jgi:hypothetical protein
MNTILHILQEFPHYDETHQALKLHGKLLSVLGDDPHNVSSIVAFLHGTGVGMVI